MKIVIFLILFFTAHALRFKHFKTRDSSLKNNANAVTAAMKVSYDMHKSYFTALASTEPLVADSSFLTIPELLQTKNQKGNVFRTKTCSSVEIPTGADVEVFKKLAMQPHKNKNKDKIACLVYSYNQARQAQRDSFATWGQDCDSFLVFSNEEWEDKEAGFKTIEVHPDNKDEKNLVGKLHNSFKEVQRRLDSKELDFDFLTVSGDDALWLIPNLRYDLENNQEVINAVKEDKGFIYGRIFSQILPKTGSNRTEFASGAGYVIDKNVLKFYVEDPEPSMTSAKAWAEDVHLGIRLQAKGIPFIHAQQATGEHMAHIFTPHGMSQPNLYNDDGWVRDYELPYLDRMQGKEGINTISKRSVLFHYLQEDRIPLHNQFFGAETCGF